jgi:hypothetical protein
MEGAETTTIMTREPCKALFYIDSGSPQGTVSSGKQYTLFTTHLIQQISRFQADTAVSAVLLENAPKDDTLVDSVRLKTILGDIPHATNRLL